MKRILPLLLLPFLFPSLSQSQEVKGVLRDRGDHKLLTLWGTHFEMGYAHGWLLGEEILSISNNYAVEVFGDLEYYEFVLSLFSEYFEIPEYIMDEAEGVVAGIEGAVGSAHVESLGRDLTALDILISTAVVDIHGLDEFCSSISAWGSATGEDPDLEGSIALVRDLDWNPGTGEDKLTNHHLIIAYDPEEEGEARWVSVAFTGYLGCISCMNENGVAALQNQGNSGTSLYEVDTSERFVPMHLSMREGVERVDSDGDGIPSINDVALPVESNPRLGSYEVHLLSPWTGGGEPAAVLECNHRDGSVMRYASDDPNLAPDILAVTNHDRLLNEPVECDRYETIVEMVNGFDHSLTLEDMWEIERAVKRDDYSLKTIQTMAFLPHDPSIMVSFADGSDVAPDKEPVHYTWEELFTREGDPEPPGEGGETGVNYEGDETAGWGCLCTLSERGKGPILLFFFLYLLILPLSSKE